MTRTSAAVAAAFLWAIACGGGGGGGSGHDGGDGNGATATPDPVDTSPLDATGTIAYARGAELHLVEPDGSGDRVVWRAPAIPQHPELTYHVTSPAWRPDGGELAFASDHEMAFSPYESDVYAIRPDGKALRKLTNGPTRERQRTFATGTVTVRVSNPGFDSGPYVIIAQGAEPQSGLIGPGETKIFTFTDVADLGDGLQPVVAAYGTYRWFGGAAADVKPGRTVDAGQLVLSGELSGFGASTPFWRSDASAVAYFSTPCILESTDAVPAPGWAYRPLVSPDALGLTCGADWGPTAATADQLLIEDSTRGDGAIDIVRVTQGATSAPPPITAVNGFHTPDLHWSADGGGFYVVTYADLMEPMQIHEYRFDTGALTPLGPVDLAYDPIRRFTVSPDGAQVVFERTDELLELISHRTDLWIMDRDGSNLRLLAADAKFPAWNPSR